MFANIGKDMLIPKVFARENKQGVPTVSLWSIGIIGAILGGFINLNSLANSASMALLFVYLMVALSVLVFRKTNSEFKREFKKSSVCPDLAER